MRILKFSSVLLMTGLLFTACSDDDNGGDTPEPVNEDELITTLSVTLTPDGGGDAVTLKKFDSDGDGPLAPEITSGNLTAGTTYSGSILVLNETESPAENVTLEVVEEGGDHQFFYIPDANLDITTTYGNNDAAGNPLGTEFTLTTGDISTGNLTITLRHEPKKPNDGTLDDAGGETDVDGVFPISIE